MLNLPWKLQYITNNGHTVLVRGIDYSCRAFAQWVCRCSAHGPYQRRLPEPLRDATFRRFTYTKSLSADALTLLRSMLHQDPAERERLGTIAESAWMRNHCETRSSIDSETGGSFDGHLHYLSAVTYEVPLKDVTQGGGGAGWAG